MVRETYAHFKAGRRSVVINAHVSFGKTRLAARFASDILSRGKRMLMLAHTTELVTQPQDDFAEFGIRAGIIKAGFDFEPELPIQVASVQTLAGRLDLIEAPDLIIVDEAHHSTAGQWASILSRFPGGEQLQVSC